MGIFDNKSAADFPVTEINGLDIKQETYVNISAKALYTRIIYAVIKEINTDDKKMEMITLSASDNFSPASWGFVHFLADAMANKKQIFIKKVWAVNQWIFEKSSSEQRNSPDVIELDFRKFEQASLLQEYYGMLFLALEGAARGIRISQGLLLKISRLSEMMADKRQIEAVETQLTAVSDSLKDARTAYLDAGSSAEFAVFDTEPTEKAVNFVYQLLSNLTGYSIGFLKGEKSGSSLSDSGESDRKQNREATEFYFNLTIQSVLESIFKETFKLKPNLDNIENLPVMLSAIEMWGEGSPEGKKFLYNQIGLREEHLDLSKPESETKTSEELIVDGNRTV